MPVLKNLGRAVLALIIVGALLATIVPRFLDRIYHRGPASDHFDGERFFNPDGEDTTVPTGRGGRGGFFWRQLTGSDGRPAWPERIQVSKEPIELLIPRRVYADNRSWFDPKQSAFWECGGTYMDFHPLFIPCDQNAKVDNMLATWIGHATVLVQTQELNILTDPIWSERASPFAFFGPKRVMEPGIRFEDLPTIDLVLLSHNHYDHMDLPTLKRLWKRDRPLIVTSLGNDAILRSHGIDARAADWGQAITVRGRTGERGPVRVHVTRNHHWGSRWFADRNRALWSSFVVTLPGGNLFFAGDTGFGDGRWPAEAASLGPVRLALLPIGAFRFEAGQMASGSHIGPIYAAEVHERLGASTSLPIHWGTFRLSYEAYDTPPRLLAHTLRCTGQTGFPVAAIGRPVEIPAYRPPRPARDVSDERLEACLNTPAVRALR